MHNTDLIEMVELTKDIKDIEFGLEDAYNVIDQAYVVLDNLNSSKDIITIKNENIDDRVVKSYIDTTKTILGLEDDTVSLEADDGIITKTINAIKKAVKWIIDSVKKLFRKIGEFLGILDKKEEKQRFDFSIALKNLDILKPVTFTDDDIKKINDSISYMFLCNKKPDIYDIQVKVNYLDKYEKYIEKLLKEIKNLTDISKIPLLLVMDGFNIFGLDIDCIKNKIDEKIDINKKHSYIIYSVNKKNVKVIINKVVGYETKTYTLKPINDVFESKVRTDVPINTLNKLYETKLPDTKSLTKTEDKFLKVINDLEKKATEDYKVVYKNIINLRTDKITYSDLEKVGYGIYHLYGDEEVNKNETITKKQALAALNEDKKDAIKAMNTLTQILTGYVTTVTNARKDLYAVKDIFLNVVKKEDEKKENE